MKFSRKFIILSIAIVIGLLMLNPMMVGASDKVKIAFATHLKGGGIDEKTIMKFKEAVEDISNQRIEVEVFVGGVLGNETDLWELLGTNEIQMNMCGEIIIPSFAPGKYVFGVPFLYEDPKDIRAILDGSLGTEIKKLINQNGKMKVLDFALREPRMLTSNKAIKSIDDIKGLKLRMPPTPEWVEVWKELGANVVSLAGSEIYGALQSGLIDAQDNPASVNVSFKFYEVQKYMTRTNHIIGFRTFLISESFYNSLTCQEQYWILDAASKAINYYEETVRGLEEENIEILKEKGLALTEIDTNLLRQRTLPAIERLRKNWDEEVYDIYVKPYLP